nr:MAG TPA: SeqA protein/DNA Complex-DNA complex, Recognition of hemimethylated.5A [Bacteriophage sp.]
MAVVRGLIDASVNLRNPRKIPGSQYRIIHCDE